MNFKQGFHFQRPIPDWPTAVAQLPAGTWCKSVDDLHLCRDLKQHNPGVMTVFRKEYTAEQRPSPDLETNKQLARRFLNTFIDGTFWDQGLYQWIDAIEGWNEYLANSQTEPERLMWLSWCRAINEVWSEEYRSKPELNHIRLVSCNTAIGNDIDVRFARIVQAHDGILGYHNYTFVEDGVIGGIATLINGASRLPVNGHGQSLHDVAGDEPAITNGRVDDWRWLSGRWAYMDEQYLTEGVAVNWLFTESGAFRDVFGGWRHGRVYDANLQEYIDGALTYQADRISQWNAGRGGRALGACLFTVGWTGSWNLYELDTPHLTSIAEFVRDYDPAVTEPPPPPPPPPEPGDGLPRVPYKRTYWVVPAGLSADQRKSIYVAAAEAQVTVGPSYDDAGLCAPLLENSTAVLFGIPMEERPAFINWFNEHYPGVILEFREVLFFSLAAWPTDYQVITQRFGARPEYYGQWGLPGHEGVDIRAPFGAAVYAAAAGTVYRMERDESQSNYGIHVRIEHQNGYKTIYAHLREVDVEEGQTVTAGQQIASADSTGNSSGSHLHFGMKRPGGMLGWPYDLIDPEPFLEPLAPGAFE